MKFISLIILLVLFTAPVFADGDEEHTKDSRPVVLNGMVTDKNSGETLAGVLVKLEGTEKMAYTDFNGSFSFSDLEPGKYKIITDYVSYEKKTYVADFTEYSDPGGIEIRIEKKKQF